jgi:hypothetical protein
MWNYTYFPIWTWSVVAAPAASLYAVPDVTTLLNTTTVNTTVPVFSNGTAYVNQTVMSTTTFWRRETTAVNLTCNAKSDNDNDDIWDTCFRPDVDGTYILMLEVYTPLFNCRFRKQAAVEVSCAGFSPIAIVTNQTVTLTRTSNVHVMLNGSASRDSQSTIPLSYAWNFVSGPKDVIPSIHNQKSATADVVLSTAGTYIFSLTVSDGCHVHTAYARVIATCSDNFATKNNTIFSPYDGTVPINMMTLTYDYVSTLPTSFEAAPCQTQYSWTLVAYTEYAPASAAFRLASLSAVAVVFLAFFSLLF